jgi:hypothetical protein
MSVVGTGSRSPALDPVRVGADARPAYWRRNIIRMLGLDGTAR